MQNLINTAETAKLLKVSTRTLLRRVERVKYKFPQPIQGRQIGYDANHAFFWKREEIIAWLKWFSQDSIKRYLNSYKDFIENETKPK